MRKQVHQTRNSMTNFMVSMSQKGRPLLAGLGKLDDFTMPDDVLDVSIGEGEGWRIPLSCLQCGCHTGEGLRTSSPCDSP